MKKSKYIDHTLLKAFSTTSEIKLLCQEAIENDFKSVCVNPTHIELCKNELKDSDVLVCTVVGFPLGATLSAVKAYETRAAIEAGADEIDMVMNIGAAKEGNFELVYSDVKAVVEAAAGKTVKVILENCYLDESEIISACEACVKAGADFVKTSTGFGTHGATKEHVKLMKDTVKNAALVKAAGGVRTPEDLVDMIELGADRIGTSSGVKLIQGKKSEGNY